jgi:hypothetical protein
VVKFALLAGAIACCASDSAKAVMADSHLRLGLAFAETARSELVRWNIERPVASCNLRIPCPLSGLPGQRRRFHLSYRGQAVDELSATREPYKPCPASVAFPNGRLACLGLP